MFNILCALLAVPLTEASTFAQRDDRYAARLYNHLQRQVTGNDHLHRRAQAGVSAIKIDNKKMRDIEFGDLNFVHVTDTNGWLAGHLQDQPEFSADFGDFVSFSERLTDIADDRNVDLLFVETGNRHLGAGLGKVDKKTLELSSKILAQQNFDVISLGNTELFSNDVFKSELNTTKSIYKNHFLSSNVEYYAPNNTWVPAGERYRLIETKNKKLRVLAFSFIFDYDMNANNSRITHVEDAVQQSWFTNALKEIDYDVILVAGHIPVRDYEEFDAIVEAIREVNSTVPIQGFGGHTLLRDFRKFDNNAVALESGRFLETIGFASLNITHKANSTTNSTRISSNGTSFFRRYIDFNPSNLAFHTKTDLSNFTTNNGAAVSQLIANARTELNLTNQLQGYNKVKKTYQTEWAKFNDSNSLYKLLIKDVYPKIDTNLTKNGVNRASLARVVLGNTNSYRYPLFKGPVTPEQLTVVSPFDDVLLVAEDVPLDSVASIETQLNQNAKFKNIGKRAATNVSAPAATSTYVPKTKKSPKNGYVTYDDFGNDGDDVIRSPIKKNHIPSNLFFTSYQNVNSSTENVDLVFRANYRPKVAAFLNTTKWNGTLKVYNAQPDRALIASYFAKKN